MGQHGVALSGEGSGEELTEVTEPNDGDFEGGGGLELVGESKLGVERLGRVDALNVQSPTVKAEGAGKSGRRFKGQRPYRKSEGLALVVVGERRQLHRSSTQGGAGGHCWLLSRGEREKGGVMTIGDVWVL